MKGAGFIAATLLLALSLAAASSAEVVATHDAFIRFKSTLFPTHLPRSSTAPVGIRIEGHVKARKGQQPAPMTTIELAIHRAADLSHSGLPVCEINRIDPASSSQALAACGGAKIGYGQIRALLRFPGTKHIHFLGHVLIFNGRLQNGRPAILLHVYNPVLHTSFVFPLTITHNPNGRYATILKAHVQLDRWSSVTDFRLIMNRSYSYHGHRRGFLNASCPAPHGLKLGIAPFVVATLGFADGSDTKIPVVGSCEVAG